MNVILPWGFDTDPLVLKKLLMTSSRINFFQPPVCIADPDKLTSDIYFKKPKISDWIGPYKNEALELVYSGASDLGPPESLIEVIQKYLVIDRGNEEFITTVIEGIAKMQVFSDVFIPNEDNSDDLSLTITEKWIISNRELIISLVNGPGGLVSGLEHGDPDTVKNLYLFDAVITELSMSVTTIMLYSAKYNVPPFSCSEVLNKLLALRLSNPNYTQSFVEKKRLPFILIESVLSDQTLSKITVPELLKFREKTSSYFEAWQVEAGKLEIELLRAGFQYSNEEIDGFIKTEINPRLLELKKEIEKIKRDLFHKVIISVSNTTFSAIGCGYLSSLSVTAAISAFMLANIKNVTVIKDIIGTHFNAKDVKSSNSLTYLLKARRLG